MTPRSTRILGSTGILERGHAHTNAARLEGLWSSAFGDAYTQRNAAACHDAGAWHHALCARLGVRRVLEVGCNLGLNLTRVGQDDAFRVCGMDVCASALRQAARCWSKLSQYTSIESP